MDATNQGAAAMGTLIVQHRVRDYRKWRRAYDAHAPARRKAGLRSAEVYRGADNQHKVAIVFKVENVDKAKAFAGSDDLRGAMKAAGVIGKPTITFVEAGVQPARQPVRRASAEKHGPREMPPEASVDTWKRFQQAFRTWQKGRAKSRKVTRS